MSRGAFIEMRSLLCEAAAAAGSLVKFLKISLCHIFLPNENALHFELVDKPLRKADYESLHLRLAVGGTRRMETCWKKRKRKSDLTGRPTSRV